MKPKLNQQMLDYMSKDPGNWRGPFYFNSKDPRLMVPKINPSMGWTLNFSNPYTYITLILIAAIFIAISFIR